jgi:hypothetical protein
MIIKISPNGTIPTSSKIWLVTVLLKCPNTAKLLLAPSLIIREAVAALS